MSDPSTMYGGKDPARGLRWLRLGTTIKAINGAVRQKSRLWNQQRDCQHNCSLEPAGARWRVGSSVGEPRTKPRIVWLPGSQPRSPHISLAFWVRRLQSSIFKTVSSQRRSFCFCVSAVARCLFYSHDLKSSNSFIISAIFSYDLINFRLLKCENNSKNKNMKRNTEIKLCFYGCSFTSGCNRRISCHLLSFVSGESRLSWRPGGDC